MWITLHQAQVQGGKCHSMPGVTATMKAAPAPPTPRRETGALATSLATAVAVATVLVSSLELARDAPELVGNGGAAARLPLVLVEFAAAVVMVAGAWSVRTTHPLASTGLAVAVVASLLPLWAAWPWLPGPVRAGVLAAAPVTVAGLAQVALGWPTQPSPAARATGRAVFGLAGTASLGHLLGYNPFADPGCFRTCQDVQPLLGGLLTTRAAVMLACLLTIAAAAVAIAAVAAGGRARAPRSVAAAVVLALVVLAAAAAVRLAGWGAAPTSLSRLAPEPLAVAVVGGVLCGAGLRTARTRAAIERLATQLSDPATALRRSSGAIRGVQFAIPDDGRWTEAAGQDVGDPPAPGSYLILPDASAPELRLLLARRTDQGEVLAGLTPATRWALRNAQLAAVARARLAEVQASQRRIVAASDAERRRIERDLHDGAQQRLVSVAFHLRVALAGADPATAAQLTGAEAGVRDALTHLRQLAHGIFPSVLANEGLATALDELVAASDVPATLTVRVDGVADAQAMAAYATVVAALDAVQRPSAATRAQISVIQDGDTMTIRVELTRGDGAVAAPDCTDAADRVGALGGHLTIAGPAEDGTMTVTAVLPCGS
jgi:signal transduction histidine kinase